MLTCSRCDIFDISLEHQIQLFPPQARILVVLRWRVRYKSNPRATCVQPLFRLNGNCIYSWKVTANLEFSRDTNLWHEIPIKAYWYFLDYSIDFFLVPWLQRLHAITNSFRMRYSEMLQNTSDYHRSILTATTTQSPVKVTRSNNSHNYSIHSLFSNK